MLTQGVDGNHSLYWINQIPVRRDEKNKSIIGFGPRSSFSVSISSVLGGGESTSGSMFMQFIDAERFFIISRSGGGVVVSTRGQNYQPLNFLVPGEEIVKVQFLPNQSKLFVARDQTGIDVYSLESMARLERITQRD